ncbi:hypothetical protein J0383_07965 [Flavobacterium endoglycinae]|uniref:Uncharacterized protein n=1 Tax=Flavobacterium endoglycinae TaxID=2816357 RepID=A0ABX7QI20_9FLAO|nr:hypothetical protein [Flavobacterium endoglycinae]QSW90735.1 hypothetical protein J0383_07965 [Flavobacterium endoglycinae]
MSTIYEILGITADEFDIYYFDSYLKWCEKVSVNLRDAQKLICYPPLFRYYKTEIAKCEEEFRLRIKNYQNSKTVTLMDKKRLYERCTEIVHQTCRPVPLIEAAIIAQPVNREFNISVLCVAVRGVKIDSITLRLN